MDYIVIGKSKDTCGRVCEVCYNKELDRVSFRRKNPNYARRKYECAKLKVQVDVPRYLDVLDVPAIELINLRNKFPEYLSAFDKCIPTRIRVW